MTEKHLKRLSYNWKGIAKEEVKVELIRSALYAYGSELAILRLFFQFRNATNTRAAYSQNLRTWYFCLELKNDQS